MAPTGLSSKGKATKPGSKPSQTPRSRNTTPLPNVRASVEASSTSSYFGNRLSSYLSKSETTVEEVLENGGNGSHIPTGKQLLVMRDHVEKTVMKNAEARCTQSEGALRELMNLKKNRAPRERDRDKAGEDRERKLKLKKANTKHDDDGKHPPAIGAHGVARQDGGDAKGKFALSDCCSVSVSVCASAGAGAGAGVHRTHSTLFTTPSQLPPCPLGART